MKITNTINERVMTIMELKQLSRSNYASILETSLPVLTHISSGRNKPGLEFIQKVIEKFPDISPDWLLMGKGEMYRTKQVLPVLDKEIDQLSTIQSEIEIQKKSISQIEQYNRILIKEINYLAELQHILTNFQANSSKQIENIESIRKNIQQKLK
jgi:hypothetical protein